jgi:CheY-like chemotaxis protein
MKPRKHGQIKVLAVEEGLDNQMLIRLFLKDYPCHLAMANDGQEAVHLYARNHYDLVLIDLSIPVMDGYAVTREIRELEKRQQRNPAPIIAMTADTHEEQNRKSMFAGFSDILQKPLSQNKLWRLLDRIRAEPVKLVFLKEVLRELIPGYLHNRHQDLRRITGLLESKDYGSIALIGHGMKGSGSGYGIPEVSRIGKVIENAAELEEDSRISQAVTELEAYLKQLRVIYTRDDDR